MYEYQRKILRDLIQSGDQSVVLSIGYALDSRQEWEPLVSPEPVGSDSLLDYFIGKISLFSEALPQEDAITIKARGYPALTVSFISPEIDRVSLYDPVFFHKVNDILVTFVTGTVKPLDTVLYHFIGKYTLLTHDTSWLRNGLRPAFVPAVSKDVTYGLFGIIKSGVTTIYHRAIVLPTRPNYACFLTDCLPHFLALCFARQIADVPVFCHTLTPLQRQILQFFDVDMTRIRVMEPDPTATTTFGVHFREAVVPALVPIPHGTQMIRAELKRKGLLGKPRRRRLLIERRVPQFSSDRLVNKDEVADVLEKRGFEKVFPEDMPFAEQVEMFSETAILIAASGSGMVNMLFAPEKAILVELLPEHWDQTPDSYSGGPRRLTSSLGQEYYRVICRSTSDAPTDVWTKSFVCDTGHLVRLVDWLDERIS
ncbi:MAG: glycosyltransferase family 61 protein [Alphaproteobacteria bacterium]